MFAFIDNVLLDSNMSTFYHSEVFFFFFSFLCYALMALWRRYSFNSRCRAAELSPAHKSIYHLWSLCFTCHIGMKIRALAPIFPAVSAALWSFGTHFLACLKRQASIPLLWLCVGTLPVQDTDYCEQNHRLFWARVIYVQLAAKTRKKRQPAPAFARHLGRFWFYLE